MDTQPERTALVLVEMINDVMADGSPLWVGPTGKDILPALQRLLGAAREAQIPVFFTHLGFDPEDSWISGHGNLTAAVKGTPGDDVIPELAPRPGEIILHKPRLSCFFATELDILLRQRGVTRVILGGVATDVCIATTTADGVQLGYRVSVVADCVTAPKPDMHQFGLRQVRRFGGEVISLDDATSLLAS